MPPIGPMAQVSRIGLGKVGSYSKIGTPPAGAWAAGPAFQASGASRMAARTAARRCSFMAPTIARAVSKFATLVRRMNRRTYVMAVVISKDGTRIGFDREGQGPPVVLVDGAMCYRGSGPMKPLAAKLAPHFTVFTYDRRGRGESGDTQPWSIEREVEDIAALVREAGQPVYLYGISSGAVLALEAADRGVPIRKLALYEAPLMVDDTRP